MQIYSSAAANEIVAKPNNTETAGRSSPQGAIPSLALPLSRTGGVQQRER